MEEGNGSRPRLTAGAVLSASRREVELADGSTVLVRKLKLAEHALIIGGIPDLSALALESKPGAPARNDQVAHAEGMIHKFIAAACLDPKFSLDPSDGPTPGDLSVEDQMAIFHAVMDLSGFAKKAAEGVLPLSRTSA